MKYTVLWTPQAERQLAALWMDAKHRDAITRAAHQIDALLSFDAHDAGESRFAGQRIVIAAPLGVLFVVNPQDCLAQVVDVWQFDTHGRQ